MCRLKSVITPEVEQLDSHCFLELVVQVWHVVKQVSLERQQAVSDDRVQLHTAAPAGVWQHRLLHCCGQVGHLQRLQKRL